VIVLDVNTFVITGMKLCCEKDASPSSVMELIPEAKTEFAKMTVVFLHSHVVTSLEVVEVP
jgi:hypothetical protein